MDKYYKNNLLPHWHPDGATFFVTFRLEGSLPKSYLSDLIEKRDTAISKLNIVKETTEREKLRLEILKEYSTSLNSALDKAKYGPTWLKHNDIAEIVKAKLHEMDGSFYDLYAYCVMSNHVHVLFKMRLDAKGEYYSLGEVMKLLKGATALKCSKALENTNKGSFWAKEYYDSWLRHPEQFDRCVWYILKNPVMAGICQEWQEFPHSFLKAK